MQNKHSLKIILSKEDNNGYKFKFSNGDRGIISKGVINKIFTDRQNQDREDFLELGVSEFWSFELAQEQIYQFISHGFLNLRCSKCPYKQGEDENRE